MLPPESQSPRVGNENEPRFRLVFYEYCISLVFVTLRRPSQPYLVPVDSWGVLPGLPYTLLTLALGWWGIPWGLIYTPLVLWTNLSGGREITAEERRRWQLPETTEI